MSKFTGKCDLYDSAFMIHEDPEDFAKNSKIYLGDGKLDIKNANDLIPYCTHLTASACYTKDSGNTIHLSNQSFIVSEEREFLSWKVIEAIKGARKAKKVKKPFDFNYIKSQECFFLSSDPECIWRAIIEIINKNPKLMKIHIPSDYREARYFFERWVIPEYFSNIHDPMHIRYREEFVKFCGENGYSIIEWNEDYKDGKKTEGKYHPVIWHMCLDIAEYYKMIKKFEEDYKASEEAYNIGG